MEQDLRRSLSSRLLLLTLSVIMIVEVLVYVPSVAQFRKTFILERLAAAEVAALSLGEVPRESIGSQETMTILEAAGVRGIAISREDRSELVAPDGVPPPVEARYDMRDPMAVELIEGAFETLWRGGDGVVAIVGSPPVASMESLSIILDERALFDAMAIYSRNIFLLSLIISVITAGTVFLWLNKLLLGPLQRIIRSMTAFAEHPDDPAAMITPSGRRDEVGLAEQQLARMQEDLRHALNQRRRLADLGAAVSKVNHDLRNILATAQLASDRLLAVEDPKIKAMSERMISAIDRAIALCERTLKYGKAEEPPARLQQVALRPLVAEVGVSLGLSDGRPVTWCNEVENDTVVQADPDQLFRILLNLGRNAVQAINNKTGEIRIAAEHNNGAVNIRMTDSGPGLPAEVQENLFVPFASSGKGGTGLGLAISAELTRGQGGDIALETTGETGTVFRLTLSAARSRGPRAA